MKRSAALAFVLCTVQFPTFFGGSADADGLLAGLRGFGNSTSKANAGVVFVDKHTYRHCHNIHTRTYCHKSDRLPINWPPLSDTPHRT